MAKTRTKKGNKSTKAKKFERFSDGDLEEIDMMLAMLAADAYRQLVVSGTPAEKAFEMVATAVCFARASLTNGNVRTKRIGGELMFNMDDIQKVFGRVQVH